MSSGRRRISRPSQESRIVVTRLVAATLVAITVVVHAVGLATVLRAVTTSDPASLAQPRRFVWLLVRITWWLILVHVLEITVWALFYASAGCLPDAEAALYFSGVTYTTLGYGDVVLAEPWRLLGPIEGLTGILMCALSTGLFFAVVSRIHVTRAAQARTGSGPPEPRGRG